SVHSFASLLKRQGMRSWKRTTAVKGWRCTAAGRRTWSLPPLPARTEWAGHDAGTDTSIPPREGDRDLRRRRRSQCLGSRETARRTATFEKPFNMPKLLDAVRYELEH